MGGTCELKTGVIVSALLPMWVFTKKSIYFLCALYKYGYNPRELKHESELTGWSRLWD